MIDNVHTGQNIAAFRQRLGWTQGELAGRLNVTHQAVSKWENGVAFPDISTLYNLSQLFGVSMEILLTGEPTAPENVPEPTVQPKTVPTETPEPILQYDPDASKTPTTPSNPDESAAEADMYDWNEIISLAPFASREALDHLIEQCESTCDREHISELAPFISRQTLDRLIHNASNCADWDFILSLAPFASHDTLDWLTRQCEDSCDREHLHALAPFLRRDTIDRLILGSIGRSAPVRPVPRPEERRENRIAAWSEAHEQQMEQAACAAEMIEKQTEAAMRKAERIAERQMERAARRAERIAEKQLERAARHAEQSVLYSDERRTQIIDAIPACSSPDEYADRIVSLLYKNIDPAYPIVSRFEKLRLALLNQDFSVLNEFAQLLDEYFGPEWLEEYASLCPTGEIPPDSEH